MEGCINKLCKSSSNGLSKGDITVIHGSSDGDRLVLAKQHLTKEPVLKENK